MRNVFFAVLAAVLCLALPGPVQAEETIKLAGMFNLTGGMSSIDVPGLNGSRLAAKLINAQGGVLGRPLEVIGYDTKTDPEVSAIAARRAVADGVAAGLGYGDTTFVNAAAPTFVNANLPFVTSGATHPELPKRHGDYFFMVPFGDDDQAFAIADYAAGELGIKNVVVWTDNSMDFTKALSNFFKQRIQELDVNLVHEDFFMMGDVDFSAQVARLKNASHAADAVFVAAVPSEAGLTARQIREAGLTLPIISCDGFDTELLVTVPGPELAHDIYFSSHTYREDTRAEVLHFIDEYIKEYGREPENAFAALGFDAVNLLADAIVRAQTTDGPRLRDALAATRGFKGVTGEIAYTRPSMVPAKAVSVISVKQGVYKVESIWMPKN